MGFLSPASGSAQRSIGPRTGRKIIYLPSRDQSCGVTPCFDSNRTSSGPVLLELRRYRRAFPSPRLDSNAILAPSPDQTGLLFNDASKVKRDSLPCSRSASHKSV